MARRHVRMLTAVLTGATALALVAAEPAEFEPSRCTIGGAGIVAADRARPDMFRGEASGTTEQAEGSWTHQSVEFGTITLTVDSVFCRNEGSEVGDLIGTATIEGDPTVYDGRIQVDERSERSPSGTRRQDLYTLVILDPVREVRVVTIQGFVNGRIDVEQ